MSALTLWPEWAWAIATLDKRVENRGWMHRLPPGSLLAIHAGAAIGGRPGPVARDEGMAALVLMALRAGWQILGPTWRLGSTALTATKGERSVWIGAPQVRRSAVVAVGRLAIGPQPDQELGWAVPGQRHWWMDRVWPLAKPVACTGRQGLWRLPPNVDAMVRAQVDDT